MDDRFALNAPAHTELRQHRVADSSCAAWRMSEETRIFRYIVQLACECGFEYCAFGVRMAVPLSCPVEATCSNYPEHFQSVYKANRYVDIDPAVRNALGSRRSVIWGQSIFKETPHLGEMLRRFNISCGVTRCYHVRTGITALFTTASTNAAMCPERVSGHREKIESISDMASRGMSKILLSRLLPALFSHLTKREKEVLRWTGDGKTAADIAQILCISTRTVNFHLNNAMAKLEAVNKTNAVVKAAMLGLIS